MVHSLKQSHLFLCTATYNIIQITGIINHVTAHDSKARHSHDTTCVTVSHKYKNTDL